MKLTNFISATLTLVMGLTVMTACSGDDDNNEPEVSTAGAIAGVYTGKQVQTVTMGGTQMDAGTYEDFSYTITATSDDEVSITIPQHNMSGQASMVIPEMTVSGVRVSLSNGVYTLARTENTQQVGAMGFKTTLQGTVEGNVLKLETASTPGSMPVPIIASFTGTKK